MATAHAKITNGPATNVPAMPFESRSVKFTPLAESEPIEITVGMVRSILAVRSRSGKEPAPADIMKFMMLCKSRQLNPFCGDAFLLGYDSKDGTKWNLITAIQSLRKRAEANPNYRGTECGVVLRDEAGGRIEREGSIVDDGEKLLGGWAKVYREDRTLPFYASVKLAVYNTEQSRWSKDPGGMIVKVAEAAALRQAFPSDLAGLYLRDEFERGSMTGTPLPAESGIAGLKARLLPTIETIGETPADEAFIDPPHDDAGIDQTQPEDDGNQDAGDSPASQLTAEEQREFELEQQAKGRK